MPHKPFLLIQQGIPAPQDWLEIFCRPIWFVPETAQSTFLNKQDTTLLLVRANFNGSPELLDCLPQLASVGLVSTGSDNLPLNYLQQRGITLYTAKGANARAVQEYCIQALAHWALEYPHEVERGVGIIGKGRIGSLLLEFIQRINIPVSWYDPFLPGSQPLEQVLQHAILSYHVPLTREGPWPTVEFIHRIIFQQTTIQRIINTSRGGIWHLPSLDYFSQQGMIWAQDVYPTEPPAVLPQARFSTPHIAGYSTIGRLQGIEKVLQAMLPDVPPIPRPPSKPWYLAEESSWFTQQPQLFQERRNTFPWRKEFAEFTAEERAQFKEKFSGLPPAWFAAIWPHEKG